MAVKLYLNKTWLANQLLVKKKTPEQIAREQGVSHMTIRRAAEKFGIKIVNW